MNDSKNPSGLAGGTRLWLSFFPKLPYSRADNIEVYIYYRKCGELMECPKCSAKLVEYRDKEAVVVDYCFNGCKGIWLDKSELAILATTETNHPEQEQLLQQSKVTEMECPRCPGEKLLEMPYMSGESLFVDICRECQGVFLDSKEMGELQRLAARAEPGFVRLKRASQRIAAAGFTILTPDKAK